MIPSIIWAAVTVYLLVRVEVNARLWMASKSPLNHQQFQELSEKIQKLQEQVSKLAISKGYEDE